MGAGHRHRVIEVGHAVDDLRERARDGQRRRWPRSVLPPEAKSSKRVPNAASACATVPCAATYSRLPATPVTRKPAPRSHVDTAATDAGDGEYAARNCAGVSQCPYCARPGVVSVATSAAAEVALRIRSTTSKSTGPAASARPRSRPACTSGDNEPVRATRPVAAGAAPAENAGATVAANADTATTTMGKSPVLPARIRPPVQFS